MPWKEIRVVDLRTGMIEDWLKGNSITSLSKAYGISRKTIYKWIKRYEKAGKDGLKDNPKTPKKLAKATEQRLVDIIIELKLKHLNWGPKKLRTILVKEYSQEQWPTVSTIGRILQRRGLVKHRRKKTRTPKYAEPFLNCDRPNEVWSIDFKGHFWTGDGKICYPLTISDNNSRFLLLCRGLSKTSYAEVQPWIEWVFRMYGLPRAIRTDNGPPFASVGCGGLSRLGIWFTKLGIIHERIDTGHPEQNGRHERMHRTLKQATAKPPKANMLLQQQAFDAFLEEYNQDRPHEALGMQTPASVYSPSPIPFPQLLAPVKYVGTDIVRMVRHNGEIKWDGGFIYISESLALEPLALDQIDDTLWEVRFCKLLLGFLNTFTRTLIPLQIASKGREV
jgi:transposase InsO family protein